MDKSKLSFSAEDEYGRKLKLKREVIISEEEDYGTIPWFLDQFKDFLHAYGFTSDQTEYLIYLERGERVEYEGQTVLHRQKM